jgi:dipeptidyl-peptidase-4
VDVADGMARRLPAQSPVADPRLDPAGRRIAYVCDGALRVIEADGTGDRVIATADQPDVTFGIGEHTGYAGLGGLRGYWWAPDGAGLLVARVDFAGVQRWHVGDPAEPGRTPRVVHYPAAGTANADVTLWIAGLDGSRTQARWDRDAFEYVPGAGWDAHGPYAVVQSRDQLTVRFLGIDPAIGETTVLCEQRDTCWVLLVPGSPARTASGAVVSHADWDGTRYLTVDGAPVTPAGLQLRAVLGVDGDEVLFTASAEPTETHLWTYRADDGIRKLTAEPAIHDGVRRAGTLVHVARGAAGPAGGPWSRGTASRPFPSPPWPNGRCSTYTRPGSCSGRGSCGRCCTCLLAPARPGPASDPGRPVWRGGPAAGHRGAELAVPDAPVARRSRTSRCSSRTEAARPGAAPPGNERSTATCTGRSFRIR